MPITKDQLLQSSVRMRNGIARGLLTSEEAFSRAKDSYDIITVSGNGVFFFADHHTFGVGVLSEDEWCPCTASFPNMVVPRKHISDGMITTIDQYIYCYHRNDRQINSIEELVEFVNTQEKDHIDKLFYIFFSDGTTDMIIGKNISDAYSRSGYSQEKRVSVEIYSSEIKSPKHYVWDDYEKTWVRNLNQIQSPKNELDYITDKESRIIRRRMEEAIRKNPTVFRDVMAFMLKNNYIKR